MCRCVFILLTLGLLVSCDDVLTKSDEREGRLVKENVEVDRWKAITQTSDSKPLWLDSNLPSVVDESPEIIPTKRRRLRKRKRRPLVFNEDDGHYHPRPRRRRPIRLDEVNDTWDEMEAESPNKPNKRRRIIPVYQPIKSSGSVSATISFGEENDKLREVEELVKEERILASTTTRSTTVQNIKDLIKQNGGLSLSEVLQQRNLSLTDLLKGKKQAISALITNKTENKNEPVNTNNNIIKKSTMEEQRKHVEDLYISSNNKIYNDVRHVEVITESTTEKRIFVPSHPKLYTSMDYNPHLESITEKTNNKLKSKIENSSEKSTTLPVTNAELHGSIKKKQLPEQPPKPFKISLNEIFGFEDSNTKIKNVNEDEGPLKMSFNIEELLKQSETTIKAETTAKLTQTTSKPITIQKTMQSKLKTLTPKEDLNELLTNEREKENLSKILENRNMTVDELVQLRERGSSQKHLAEIFHNNTKEPEAVVEHIGSLNLDSQRNGKTIKIHNSTEEQFLTNNENLPTNKSMGTLILNKPLKTNIEILHQSTSSEVFLKPLPDVSLSSEEVGIPAKMPSTSFPTYKIETNKNHNESPINTPFWKTVYPGTGISNENRLINKDIEEIEQNIAEAVNEDFPVNDLSNSYNEDDNFNLPIGVKSAIYASFAIMGMSLLVFVTIMFIFKWSQRHKKRLCYNENFTCSKIKSPILTGNHTPRTFKTFVSETLGRKKHIYKANSQSMSDSWDRQF